MSWWRKLLGLPSSTTPAIEAWMRLTLELLSRAFPSGIGDAEYAAVVQLLGPHMSQRNLADTLSIFTGRDYGIVYNDVLGACGQPGVAQLRTVERLLNQAGFDEWAQSV